MFSRKLGIGKEKSPPVVNFHSLLKHLKPKGNPAVINLKVLPNIKGKCTFLLSQLQDCVLAALDMTIDHQNSKVYHDVLEADDHGILPGEPGFNAECDSCIKIVAKADLEVCNIH